MEEIAYWYKYEIQRWRIGASIAWSQILLPPTIFIAVTLGNVDFLHPIQWIMNSLALPSNWRYLLFMAAVMLILAIWEAKYYTVRTQVLSTRLAYIWNVLSPNRLLFTAGHALGAGAATWCFVNLIGGRFRGLTRPCFTDGPDTGTSLCVNEYHLFVILHGAAVGAAYAANFFRVPYNMLTFPIIQQSKFFHMKTQLYPTLKKCALHILGQLRYYYIAYYLIIGPVFRGWISKNLRLKQSSVGIVDGLYNLLDVGMLWCTFVAGTTILFLLTLAQRLYNVYQTEPFHFPMESSFEDDRGRTLPKALACKQLPIVQYLAFQDLCEAASQSKQRRLEMFSLSQPGGHPHHWVAVSSASLGLLRDITVRMTEFNNSMLTTGPTRQLSGDKKMPVVSTPTPLGKVGQSFTNGSFSASLSTPVTNLSFRGPPMSASHPPMATGTEKEDKMTVPISTKLINHLKKRKAVAFFIGDLPEAPSKRLYADCQLYIWAVEAISQLACASYTEDRFGVVQKTLPDIVSALLSLQEAVEKHLKLAPNTNRKSGVRGSPATAASTQRHALRASIKTAIYRIVSTFDKHLGAISLSGEHTRRLRLFMEYKE